MKQVELQNIFMFSFLAAISLVGCNSGHQSATNLRFEDALWTLQKYQTSITNTKNIAPENVYTWHNNKFTNSATNELWYRGDMTANCQTSTDILFAPIHNDYAELQPSGTLSFSSEGCRFYETSPERVKEEDQIINDVINGFTYRFENNFMVLTSTNDTHKKLYFQALPYPPMPFGTYRIVVPKLTASDLEEIKAAL